MSTGPVLSDAAVVAPPYVSDAGGLRVLVVADNGESWFRVENWDYAVTRWYWQEDVATLRALAEHVWPGELVDADSAELWENINPRMPEYIRRARLSCAGHKLALRVADSEQLRTWENDPYAPRDEILPKS